MLTKQLLADARSRISQIYRELRDANVAPENDDVDEALDYLNDAFKALGGAERTVREPHTIKFRYNGVERVLADPQIDSSKGLISGVELSRGGIPSNQFKHFRLNLIG
jgi:hypothetical protein